MPLQCVAEPYPQRQSQALAEEFRARGFCVLRDVFVRGSVAGFRASLHQQLLLAQHQHTPPGSGLSPEARERIDPVLAPRLRQVLPLLLTAKQVAMHGGRHANVQLFEAGWDACGPAAETPAGAWHKDRSGCTGGHYERPEAVHLAMYYRDMVAGDSCGSTEIVEASHLCDTTEPPSHPTTTAQVVQFTPRKQDVVAWDQRCWHRRGHFVPRSRDDMRIVSIFGFHQTQLWCAEQQQGGGGGGSGSAGRDDDGVQQQQRYSYDSPSAIAPSLARHWAEATAGERWAEAALLGGRWSPGSVWRALEDLRVDSPELFARMMQREASAAAPRL